MRQFPAGYQAALRDVLTKWNEEGAEAARQYAETNLVGAEEVLRPCAQCGTGVRRNGRGELVHANYMSTANNHAAVLA